MAVIREKRSGAASDSGGITIGALARAAGLSRSALLYYHRLGLLKPRQRSRSNYRLYSRQEAERLEQICLYRQMGIPLEEIRELLDGSRGCNAAEILRRRLHVLGREILKLRRQQQSIMQILRSQLISREVDMINKERWIEIMRAAGLSDQDMHNWHVQFEKMEPMAHQEFLESLGINPSEINDIREWSRLR